MQMLVAFIKDANEKRSSLSIVYINVLYNKLITLLFINVLNFNLYAYVYIDLKTFYEVIF